MEEDIIINDLRDRISVKLRAIADALGAKYQADYDPTVNRYVYFKDVTVTNPGYTFTVTQATNNPAGIAGEQSIKFTIISDTANVTVVRELSNEVYRASFSALPSMVNLFELLKAVTELETTYTGALSYPADVLVVAK